MLVGQEQVVRIQSDYCSRNYQIRQGYQALEQLHRPVDKRIAVNKFQILKL